VDVPLTTPDDREVSLSLRLATAPATWNERISVVSRAPYLHHYSEASKPGTLVTDQTGDIGYSPRASSVVE
jgi:hypothetical protein